MPSPIFFYINTRNNRPMLHCSVCNKGFHFPIGIDSISMIENPIFLCSFKCRSEYKE